MHIKRLLPLTFMLAALLSCQKEMTDQEGIAGQPLSPAAAKAINTSVQSDPSSLMVYMETAPSAELLEKWEAEGVHSVARVFPAVAGSEELQARFNLDKWYVLSLDAQLSCEKAAELVAVEKTVTRIEYNKIYTQEPDRLEETYSEPGISLFSQEALPFNDPRLYQQWNYINKGDKAVAPTAVEGADVNVKDAWKLVTGDPELVVAIVDAGLMYTHPDLADNIWVNEDEIPGNGIDDDHNGYVDDVHGACFVSEKDTQISWTDEKDSGHGTHVAGIIGAVNNNGIGISGIAGGSGKKDGVKMMGCQIFKNGVSSEVAVAKAFTYAADNGASILQCSFGLDGGKFTSDNQYLEFSKHNSAVAAALKYFREKSNYPALEGGMAIFASGNEGQPYAAYPGALKDNICVSAIGPDFLPALYTNYGPGCNISAPGGDGDIGSNKAGILSTVPNKDNKNVADYVWMQGTSMACPHVTGVVALGMAYARKLGKKFTYKEMTDMVLSSVNDLDSRMKGLKLGTQLETYRGKMGTGAIDAWRLLMKIEGTPSAIIETGKRQMVNLAPFFGSSSLNLTYLGVEVSPETYETLGLETKPEVRNGLLYIKPTKTGAGKVIVHAIAGGENLGGGDAMGGMPISQEVSLISRSFKSSNGGWL